MVLKHVNIDSTVAIDQKNLHANFVEVETRIAQLERAEVQHSREARHVSIAIYGGAMTCLCGPHPAMRLSSVHAQLGDAIPEDLTILIRRCGRGSRMVMSRIVFKSNEKPGKIQIGEINDAEIHDYDEIEVEPDGKRRATVFLAFDPVVI